MCSTQSPIDILLRLEKNDVQEDSFQLDLRRKTKWVPTNFFLNAKDSADFKKFCPIDNNYVQQDSSCSGSYVNGAFSFYPPFSYEGCQCKHYTDQSTKEGYSFPPLSYVTNALQSEAITVTESPCIFKLENETRKEKS